MLQIPDENDALALMEAVRDPESSPFPPAFELTINSIPFAGNLGIFGTSTNSFTLETQDNGSMVLDGVVDGKMDRRLVNSQAALTVHIGGVGAKMFAGRMARPKIEPTFSEFLAHSGLAYLEDAKLQTALPFAGTASQLVRYVVELSQVYGSGYVRSDTLTQQVVRTQGHDNFEAGQAVKDVLTQVADEVHCVYRDSPDGPWGTFEAFFDPSYVFATPAPSWVFEAGELKDFTRDPADQTLFYDVAVERQADPQHQDDAGNPAPILGWLVRSVIPYRDMPIPPPASLTDWHTVTDDDLVNGPDAGQFLAEVIAVQHAVWDQSFSLTGYFNPLLQKYDTVIIGETDFGQDDAGNPGKRRYEWLGMIDGIKWDTKDMSMALSGRAMLLTEEFTPDAIPTVSIASDRFVTDLTTILYGTDAINGFWIAPSVVADPPLGDDYVNGFWIDEEKAAGIIKNDARGFRFDLPSWLRTTPYGTDAVNGFWIDPDLISPNVVGNDAVNGFWIDPDISEGRVVNNAGGLQFDI